MLKFFTKEIIISGLVSSVVVGSGVFIIKEREILFLEKSVEISRTELKNISTTMTLLENKDAENVACAESSQRAHDQKAHDEYWERHKRDTERMLKKKRR